MPGLVAFLFLSLVALQTYGNFVPSKVSFLLSMRYYAGNWAYNVWLVRKGDSVEKFKQLTKSAGTMREQLAQMGLDEQSLDMAGAMGLVSRFMHFEGRPLLEALPRAVDHIDDYDWLEGEVTGGMILGWNFGDGHLNGRDLLEAIQPQCGFEPGELRVIAVESQPLFTPTMHWQVFDAATGLVDQGTTELNRMRDVQPWPTGEYAEALLRGQSRTTG
jgi:nitrite reductase/ring-hydroxylating ferredoxin subunit